MQSGRCHRAMTIFPIAGKASRFLRQLPRTERRSKVRIAKGERSIWQRRFWEHTITTELGYSRHIDYIHVNPLKYGYAIRVQDCPILPMSRTKFCLSIGPAMLKRKVGDWENIHESAN